MTLSKEEAVRFLRDVLQVPDLLKEEPSLSFLNEIVKSYQHMIPWQSLFAFAFPPSQRHLPTWEEIKRNQFAKRGGMCYENNMFMKELLYAFNFDVCYTSVQVENPNDHLTIMVRGLTGNSSRHWVDVGSTFPLFQAIPFDFDTNTIEYDIGFLRQRFVKTNSVIEWHHSRQHLPYDGCKLTNDGWYNFAHIKADIPCDLNVFKSAITYWYTVEEGNEFFQKPRAVIYEKNKLIAIKGRQLLIETTNKIIDRKKLGNFDEVLQAFETYFPQLPTEIVRDALHHTVFNI
ncbi:hypothetical protein HOLleu_13901 [Holothuria leucospilota]|uniref:arylamine N-acetyltransferase n=1 Tax=Holothuria leucospilota TaxID=206669 RepID=A0A9Q1C7D7_HOLLE|nr:hypothetical protein HOLleu_13901 [Holothuria leucospilota]